MAILRFCTNAFIILVLILVVSRCIELLPEKIQSPAFTGINVLLVIASLSASLWKLLNYLWRSQGESLVSVKLDTPIDNSRFCSSTIFKHWQRDSDDLHPATQTSRSGNLQPEPAPRVPHRHQNITNDDVRSRQSDEQLIEVEMQSGPYVERLTMIERPDPVPVDRTQHHHNKRSGGQRSNRIPSPNDQPLANKKTTQRTPHQTPNSRHAISPTDTLVAPVEPSPFSAIYCNTPEAQTTEEDIYAPFKTNALDHLVLSNSRIPSDETVEDWLAQTPTPSYRPANSRRWHPDPKHRWQTCMSEGAIRS